jgi:hypothetical protein
MGTYHCPDASDLFAFLDTSDHFPWTAPTPTTSCGYYPRAHKQIHTKCIH